MTVCRGYIRVSTEEQAQEGYSLEAQVNTLRRYAEEQKWTLVEPVYVDEGKTARKLEKRDGLRRLLEDLLAGEIVLFWKLDRLNRNLRNSEWFFDEVERRRAAYYSISEPMLSTAGPGGRFVRQIMGAVAELYSGILAENVRHGMAQMARQGKWTGGPLPYGYDYQNEVLVPNKNADTARWIFERYVSGYGVRAIAAELNERGVPTSRGALWTSSTVSYVLRNPLYCGRVGFGKKGPYSRQGKTIFAEGVHEGIIPMELWERAQVVMGQRKTLPSRAAGGDYPLTGVARCELCGTAVGGARYSDKNRRAKRRMYRCGRRLHSKACILPIMNGDTLEEQFLRTVESYRDPAVVAALMEAAKPPPDLEDRAAGIRRQVADIDRELKRWDAAYGAGAMELDDYTAKVKPLRQQRKGLVDELERIERPGPAISGADLQALAGSIRSIWEKATATERKQLVMDLCEAVVVGPRYKVQIKLRSQ